MRGHSDTPTPGQKGDVMQSLDFFLPTRIIFGAGRISELRQNLGLTTQRIMLVTDPGAWDSSGARDRILGQLQGCSVEIFSAVEENPSLATVDLASTRARAARSQLVIGVGGGSPMDAAKGIAALAPNRGNARELLSGGELAAAALPVVCIPTTSGTGSEVTPYAVFTDAEDQSKGGYSNQQLFPTFSIIDPELTFSMPERIVIDTGLDVLTHAIEAYLSTLSSPLSDLFAEHAMTIVLDRLAAAAAGNRDAMSDLSYAATIAGVAIAHTSTILLHVMGYPLTVFHHLAHGRANAVMLGPFLDFMRASAPAVAAKIARLDRAFARFGSAGDFVQGLGVCTDLASYGVSEAQLDLFVEKCLVKGDLRITPAELSRQRIRAIYEAANPAQ